MTTILENHRVKLAPLEASHLETLWPIAQQMDLHRYGANDISTIEKLKNYIQIALEEASVKKSLPFIIYDKVANTAVGCTRFGQIDNNNKVLHIGWTWISQATRGTGFNHQMKFLMLKHAFETINFEKVEFRIDERNVASRKAVEKLGAKLEGILRKNTIVKDGFKRNSCCYGILIEEWPGLKNTNFKGLDN